MGKVNVRALIDKNYYTNIIRRNEQNLIFVYFYLVKIVSPCKILLNI